ncbi:kinase-like domain-containing protein [Obelidium mucronatum]|nr:kinase-like domain-containing protein [Obelidium mucronatum]
MNPLHSTPIIPKVTANHYSTIRQATLASIPAVRRRPYALRTIIKNKLKTRALIETVRRERDIHAKLINRFIVQVLASFQTPKRLYVLLEWCPTTLDAIMGFQRVIKEDACRAVVAELVVALEYLHSNCIVHRGLEPTNLMLDAFGHVKVGCFFVTTQISDFSTAITITDQDKQTADNKCLRLTRYSAPELILGERHGRCADWFSLGTIVYEMLTGNIPFGQGNVLDTLAAVK